MAKNYAYISTPPKEIKFSLPYNDNSGERISVSIGGLLRLCVIKEGGDTVNVSVEDIEWLRQALEDVLGIVKLNNEQNVQVSDTTGDDSSNEAK